LAQNKSILVASVDCTTDANKPLVRLYDIQGYPTIKLFKNGKEFLTYDGPRLAEPMKHWLTKKTGPNVLRLATKSDLVDLISKNKNESTTVLVGFFDREDSPNREHLKKVAEGPLFDEFVFAEIIADQEAASDPTTKEGVIMFRHFEEEQLETNDFSKLEAWTKKEGYPLIDDIERMFKRLPKDTKTQIGILFVDGKVDRQHPAFLQVQKLAEKLRGKALFSYLPAEEYSKFAATLGIDVTQALPQFALSDQDHLINYPYRGNIVLEELEEWLKQIKSGKVKPHMKSQPIPETNDGPVKVVVGDSFNDIVMDESKDVLLEYYAPWCGHCKTFAPDYEKLANKVSHLGNLVVAKIQGDENDTPVKVEGYPSIFYFASGKKNDPVKYEGPLNAKSVFEFVRKHAVAAKKKASRDEL
jgi:protein disulfide-isomerase A1